MRVRFDQYYVFTGPDGWCLVEMFLTDGAHEVVPGPYRQIGDQVACLERLHPGAWVGVLDDPEEIAEAMAYAGSQGC